MPTWNCLTCPEAGEGTWTEVDRAAAAHTKDTKHGTNTITVGSVRQRDDRGRVHNRKPGPGQ